MNDAQRHRGPDADGVWSAPDNSCHLGHKRLSVIDLSSAANQPMPDASGRYVIAFNGELYNFQSLKRDLEQRGAAFKTHSDTEVLLQAFIADGKDAFKTFDGMYAVAIYDAATKTLTLARDGAGEKPLYYIATSQFFAFASELRPLLKLPEISPRISERGLALYMGLRYVPAPHTLIEGINKLEPGCVVQISADGTLHHERFFRFALDDTKAAMPQDLDAFGEQVEAVLQDALERRLISDVPLGAFLSSGVDSSLACAILTKKMNRSLKTFTVGFEDDPESEHEPARAIAQTLGTEHYEYMFGVSDFERICGEIGTLLDEPNGDRSCVPTYLLSQFVREHVTVAISGDGGDEMFAGYGRYLGFIVKTAKQAWPSAGAVPQAYLENSLPVFPWTAVQSVVPQAYPALAEFAHGFGELFVGPARTMLNGLRILDFETYMPGAVLAKVDRMSMRHALEVRTPFLSPAVYALSASAPLSALTDGKTQKVVLRRLLSKYLPQRHVDAPKKGFGMPQSVFLQNKDKVMKELTAAHAILAETDFFKARKGSALKLVQSSVANINSAWATLVLARWIESVGPRL